MRMRWMKKLMLGVALLLVIVLFMATGGFVLFQGTPEWYTPRSSGTAEQRAQAAKRAEDKFAEVQNWAASARAEVAGPDYAVTSRPVSPNASTVTFTEDELNAFFEKWADWYGWNDRFGKYLQDPMIVLRDGRIILAGSVPELRTVASMHFEPVLSADGKLELNLVRVLGGKLPMPDAVWSGKRERVEQLLMQRLPAWQRGAAIDATGAANADAIKVAMAKLVLNMFRDEPGESVIFLPLINGQKIPVRLTAVAIENRSLTLTAERLSAAERAEFMGRLREKYATETALGE
jgi:hypothetical protein